jgi:hypothetical protein
MRRIIALAGLALLCAAPTAAATGGGSDSRKLRDAVTTKGILVHEAALQAIGTLSNGNRLAGTQGYDASALYVGVRAAAAGLKVSSQPFDYDLDLLADYKQPILRVTSGGPRTNFNPGIAGAQFGGDFGSMYATQSTDITAPVWAADINLPAPAAPNGNTSGCEPDDYAGMPAGAIALVQRGTCPFAQKFTVAEASGAGGALLFNEGQPGRTVPLWFNVTGLQVPWAAISVDTATALSNGVNQGLTGLKVRLRMDWRPGTYPTKNVIAETKSGDPNKVIVVGAHLDSVGTGSGINDNGSGSAMNLEIAEQIAKMKLRNKVRFVWFSAEESGLLGSEAYVASLPDSERAKIAAMLNFDMVASPNFARFVYDGDLSGRLGRHREALPRLLREPGPRERADRVRRSLGLRALHRGGHPGGRAVHGSGGDQDTGAGGPVRRDGRRAVRRLLPPGLRQPAQPQRPGPGPDERCRRARDDHARPGHGAASAQRRRTGTARRA